MATRITDLNDLVQPTAQWLNGRGLKMVDIINAGIYQLKDKTYDEVGDIIEFLNHQSMVLLQASTEIEAGAVVSAAEADALKQKQKRRRRKPKSKARPPG